MHKIPDCTFTCTVPADSQRCLLHFEGADYRTTVWVNGQEVGKHEGGYCRFSADCTDYLRDGENVLTVRCEDSPDTCQPRGKQRWETYSFGCWYVQTTGLWKPVWGELVLAVRLDSVKITPDYDNECEKFGYTLSGQNENTEIGAEIRIRDRFVTRVRVGDDRAHITQTVDLRWNPFEWKIGGWAPWDPNLYDVTFTVYQNGEVTDTVGSHFGLRKIEADEKGIRLNNVPVYQKLVLAQNYWRESGLTAAGEDALIAKYDDMTSASCISPASPPSGGRDCCGI